MLHRIDRGDGEGVRDRTVRRASSPLTQNVPAMRFAHPVPHHEKESRVPEPLDHRELVLQLLRLRVRQITPARPSAFVGLLAQKDVVALVAGRDRILRERRPKPCQIELAFGRNLRGRLQATLRATPSFRHGLGRHESPAVIGMEHTPIRRFVECKTSAQSRECIVDETPAVVDVPGISRDHPGHSLTLGKRDKRPGEGFLESPRVMQLDFHGESCAEYLSPTGKQARRIVTAVLTQRQGKTSRCRTSECVKSRAPFGDVGPCHQRPASGRKDVGIHRRIIGFRQRYEILEPPRTCTCDESRDVPVPLGSSCEEGCRMSVHEQFHAGDRPYAFLSGLNRKPHDATQIAMIRKGQTRVPQHSGACRELVRRNSTIAEGEG